jgi:hypothetical protein
VLITGAHIWHDLPGRGQGGRPGGHPVSAQA